MRRIITTGDELDAMPDGSVIISRIGMPRFRRGAAWVYADGVRATFSDQHGPYLVVWDPSTDRAPCPECEGRVRQTTNLVCERCGTDYGAGEPVDLPEPALTFGAGWGMSMADLATKDADRAVRVAEHDLDLVKVRRELTSLWTAIPPRWMSYLSLGLSVVAVALSAGAVLS